MSISAFLAAKIGDSGLDVGDVTVAGLRQALDSGSLTSAGLTAFYMGRIERLNPELHAVISVNPDAPAQAVASDEARARGAARGPLAGIPVLIKDNIAVAGQPATAGSPALASAESGDAFLVAGLRAAGAVILGKANLSEWANIRSPQSSSGWSTLGGQTVNPHGPGRNPSGSSSGSAAAVAAGLAPAAVGTETNGSIVSPASVCGVVGLKPTVGLVSRAGIVPISAVQDTAGPMTGCVADAAALLGPMAGPDPADPVTAQAAAGPAGYTAFLDPGALAGARLGIWRDGSKAGTPATAAVLDAAVARLRSCGAEIVDPVPLPGTDQQVPGDERRRVTDVRGVVRRDPAGVQRRRRPGRRLDQLASGVGDLRLRAPSGQFGNVSAAPGVHSRQVIAGPGACSNANASASSLGSLQAGPARSIPTGSPATWPAGTEIDGYPHTAAGPEVEKSERSPRR